MKRFTVRNESFVCSVCQTLVQPLVVGCRNHCPNCLSSQHVDKKPGDRAADCGGVMDPVSVYIHSKKGYMVEHRCRSCGYTSVNKLALEDPIQPDSREAVMKLSSVSAYRK
ncbi:MAG: RNHCP domain-containing protein [Firmicutes bacterium]|nr:RNHCP domain-containing protein [Bacillota bacterium]